MITFFSPPSYPNIYRIEDFASLELIREGGQARIFRGLLQKNYINQPVIVKIYEESERARRCFENEFLILRHTKYPNIIKMLGWLRHPEGLGLALMAQSFAMAKLIQELQSLPALVIRHILHRLLLALRYLHSQLDLGLFPHGIIHGDISSHNILFSFAGQPILIDFGAALVALNQNYQAFGLKKYLAPEQIRGCPGFGSDLYSLAAVMFELVSFRPFDPQKMAQDFSDLKNILGSEGQDIFYCLRACLAPSPRYRPSSAEKALDYLDIKSSKSDHACQYLARLVRDLGSSNR